MGRFMHEQIESRSVRAEIEFRQRVVEGVADIVTVPQTIVATVVSWTAAAAASEFDTVVVVEQQHLVKLGRYNRGIRVIDGGRYAAKPFPEKG